MRLDEKLEVLQALASSFHTGALAIEGGARVPFSEAPQYYEPQSDEWLQDIREVERRAEFEFSALQGGKFASMGVAKPYLHGPYAGHPPSACPSGLCRAKAVSESLEAFTRVWLDHCAETVRRKRGNAQVTLTFAVSGDAVKALRVHSPQVMFTAEQEPPSPLSGKQSNRWYLALDLQAYLVLARKLAAEVIAAIHASEGEGNFRSSIQPL